MDSDYCHGCIYLFYEEEKTANNYTAKSFDQRYYSYKYVYRCEFYGVLLDCSSDNPVCLKKCVEENRFLEETVN